MNDLTWMANLAAGAAVLVTYTMLVKKAVLLEKRVELLEDWQEGVDPKRHRQNRRDSDVLKHPNAKEGA